MSPSSEALHQISLHSQEKGHYPNTQWYLSSTSFPLYFRLCAIPELKERCLLKQWVHTRQIRLPGTWSKLALKSMDLDCKLGCWGMSSILCWEGGLLRMHTCPGLSSSESVHGILSWSLRRGTSDFLWGKERQKRKGMKRLGGVDINQWPQQWWFTFLC